ncbi:hypothetical protein F0L68_15910 [Solihabitans fulvus]|uniref:Uncharacterized protein n=1 Tax=Solihabitans fulvus TaxID=1892852 RepID=A0A5B2XDB3_9PSEU|nr:hypothetical protein [Solihabitans fulvus]KAA2261728.1 hypothetical protein F0L68_15910 [Solihabitans fulvus]
MHRAGSASWQIGINRWSHAFDVALWFRAVERIEVPAGGIVPGPLDIGAVPEPSPDAGDPAELVPSWLGWWRALAEAPRRTPPFNPERRQGEAAFIPPDFTGLAEWPRLRQLVAGRWEDAYQWHTARKRAARGPAGRGDDRTGQVVADIERELGRKALPFSLDLVVLPVVDDEVRRLGGDRYLVPEAIADGPSWPSALRALVTPIA